MDFWLDLDNVRDIHRPRTPRRYDTNTATRRRRLEEEEEPRVENNDVADTDNGYNADEGFRAFLQYSRDRHAPIDARRDIAGPDVFRIFRGWQLQREHLLQFRLSLLTRQPEVLAQVYGIDPASTSAFRMGQLDHELQEEIRADGFPLRRVRDLRELAAPDNQYTRVFDTLERTDGTRFGLFYYPEYQYGN